MVASAIGRSPNPSPINSDEDGIESGLRETLSRQAGPLLNKLKNRWVLLGLFIIATIPIGNNWGYALRDYAVLREQISAQEAVLALPEPRTDDIEAGLRSWTAARQAATEAQILELEDSTLIEKLIAAAAGTGISIQSMSTSVNSVVPVGTEVYDATPFILRVSGEIAAIESFMSLLEGDAIEALEIQNSLVAPQDGDGFTGIIRAIVFNRPIDPSELDLEQREALSRRVSDAELDAAAAGTAPGSGQ